MPSRKLIALCLMLVGCATSQPRQGQTAFQVEMGYNDTYSSTTGKISRRMCRTDDAHIQVKLSSVQLNEIGHIATRSGFFLLPSPHPLTQSESDGIMVTAPRASYALDIYHDGQHHRVMWSCNSVHDGVHPPEVREVYSAVTNALAPAISHLPESGCHYR